MIENYSFGRMRVNGMDYTEDLKIIGGEVKPDWRRESGHRIGEEDIRDILAAKPEILVIGTGSSENAQLSEKAVSEVKEQGIRLVPQATQQAVKTFNNLLDEGKSVSGAFHLTC